MTWCKALNSNNMAELKSVFLINFPDCFNLQLFIKTKRAMLVIIIMTLMMIMMMNKNSAALINNQIQQVKVA